MSTKKQKERKKSKRKEIAKSRVLARRKQIRDARKKESRETLRYETEFELKNGKQKPFVKEKNIELENIKNENIKLKIENNLKILQALEEEYINEKKMQESNSESLKIETQEKIENSVE